jgi:2-polyprenyl-3-methyl-5-hydroxy-6-metoxy-1,4-benzoquinol methylase
MMGLNQRRDLPVEIDNFNSPNAATIDFYDRNAESYIARTWAIDMSEMHADIYSRLAPGANILDIGTGSGRDALALTQIGFNVDVLEPSKSLLHAFKKRAPDFPGKCFGGTIASQDLPEEHYDFMLAVASLLHIPNDEWPDTMRKLRRISRRGGLLFISTKQQPSGYDQQGRWFTGFATPDALTSLVAQHKWKTLSVVCVPHATCPTTPWIEAWFEAV